jgi:hypothetical protein
MKNNLQKEIIKKIFANFGIIQGSDFGKFGVTQFLYSEKLGVEYEDKTVNHNIFAGECKIQDNVFRVIMVDLSINYPEFAVVFQLEQFPVHGLILNFAPVIEDETVFGEFVVAQGEGWKSTNTYIQAQALVGTELLSSYGVMWNSCSNVETLLPWLDKLVDL